jgi:hypothetical protein
MREAGALASLLEAKAPGAWSAVGVQVRAHSCFELRRSAEPEDRLERLEGDDRPMAASPAGEDQPADDGVRAFHEVLDAMDPTAIGDRAAEILGVERFPSSAPAGPV